MSENPSPHHVNQRLGMKLGAVIAESSGESSVSDTSIAESAHLSGDSQALIAEFNVGKHPVTLRGAGLVITAENPDDGCRLLYHLAPSIAVTKTDSGWEMDFGYCLVGC